MAGVSCHHLAVTYRGRGGAALGVARLQSRMVGDNKILLKKFINPGFLVLVRELDLNLKTIFY